MVSLRMVGPQKGHEQGVVVQTVVLGHKVVAKGPPSTGGLW